MSEIATDIGHVLLKCPLPPAPSAAPDPVTVTGVTSSSITVQWGEVECIGRNGGITGYSVGYSGGGSTVTRLVSGGGTRQTTLSGLTPSTEYTIEVAAVNSVGLKLGPYSTGMVERTAGEWPLAHAQEGYGVCVFVCVCVCVCV